MTVVFVVSTPGKLLVLQLALFKSDIEAFFYFTVEMFCGRHARIDATLISDLCHFAFSHVLFLPHFYPSE